MTNIVFLLAALLFAFGFLPGTVVHTHAIHREYQRIAQRVRALHELQEHLTAQQASVISQFHAICDQ
jgi:hypothetical protein